MVTTTLYWEIFFFKLTNFEFGYLYVYSLSWVGFVVKGRYSFLFLFFKE